MRPIIVLALLLSTTHALAATPWEDERVRIEPPLGWTVQHDALTQTVLLRPPGDQPERASLMLHYTTKAPAQEMRVLATRMLEATGSKVKIDATDAIGQAQGVLMTASLRQGAKTRRAASLILRHPDSSQLSAMLLARPKDFQALGGARGLYRIARTFQTRTPLLSASASTSLSTGHLRGAWHDAVLVRRAARFDPLTRTLPEAKAPLSVVFQPDGTYRLTYQWRLISGACISTAKVLETGTFTTSTSSLTLSPDVWEGSVRLCGGKSKPWKSQGAIAKRRHLVLGVTPNRVRLQGACATYMLHPSCDQPHELHLTRGAKPRKP